MIVYIAGPYMAPSAPEIRANVARAVALGHAAVKLGLVPIIPHAHGYLGVFGDPHEADGLRTRERALRVAVHTVKAVRRVDGALWIIERDDHSLSSGTQMELDAFMAPSAAPGMSALLRFNWNGWCAYASSRANLDLNSMVRDWQTPS